MEMTSNLTGEGFMKCDICSRDGTFTEVPAKDVQIAATAGFNPFEKGLVPTPAVLSVLGVSSAKMFAIWRDNSVMVNTTNWNICPACLDHLTPYIQARATQPEETRTARAAKYKDIDSVKELQAFAQNETDQDARKELNKRIILLADNLNEKVHALIEYTDSMKAGLSVQRVGGMTLPNNIVLGVAILRAFESVKDQEIIANMVRLTDLKPEYRVSLIRNLKDQAQLKAIAQNDKNPEIHGVAVGSIEDQAFLKGIVLNTSLPISLRAPAASRVTDADVLADIVTDSRQPATVRRAALEHISDQEMLSAVALGDRDDSVRGEAAKKISDPEVLKRIALSEQEPYPAQQAIAKIDDEETLKEVFRKNFDEYLALERIDEKESTNSGKKAAICTNAVKKMRDQVFIRELIGSKRAPWLVNAALGVFEDQSAIERLIGDGQYAACRWSAIRRLTNQKMLAEIVLNDKDQEARLAAIGQITDQEELRKICIVEDQKAFLMNRVLDGAVNGVTDEKVAGDLLLTLSPQSLQKHCMTLTFKITDLDVLRAASTRYKGTRLGTIVDDRARHLLTSLSARNRVYDGQKTISPEIQSLRENALSLLNAKDPAGALELFERLITAEKGSLFAWTGKAAACVALDRNEEGLGAFDHVLSMNPFIPEIWHDRAKVYARLGDTEKSVESMKRAYVMGYDKAKEALACFDTNTGDSCTFHRKVIAKDLAALRNGGSVICLDCMALAYGVVDKELPVYKDGQRYGVRTKGAKACSFCGDEEYKRLVSDGDVGICDGCIDGFFR